MKRAPDENTLDLERLGSTIVRARVAVNEIVAQAFRDRAHRRHARFVRFEMALDDALRALPLG
jgi:hypothetical protein